MRVVQSPRPAAPSAATAGGAARERGPPAPGVRLERLCKQYGALPAVRDVSLDVRQGEFLTLLGPSGSGKTTTLMMIAGFIDPTSGRIEVAGRDVTDEPPHRRNIGMVFQNYALFPHLSVAKNVAFPLDIRRVPAAEARKRTQEALDIVKLGDLGGRYPSQLSGGQQQRVALARAIVFRPPLLLMDEPLGALDKKLREHMQIELMNIHERLGVTVIYVTHDQEEALFMSDRVVVMADGEIQQTGRPDELYQRPANRFVADFVGETNILDGEVAAGGMPAIVAVAPGLEVQARASRVFAKGERASVILRPECVRVGAAAEGCATRQRGTIERVIYVGDVSRILVRLAGGRVLVAKIQNSGSARDIVSGAGVTVGWDLDAAWLVTDAQP